VGFEFWFRPTSALAKAYAKRYVSWCNYKSFSHHARDQNVGGNALHFRDVAILEFDHNLGYGGLCVMWIWALRFGTGSKHTGEVLNVEHVEGCKERGGYSRTVVLMVCVLSKFQADMLLVASYVSC
jgi:hypothetical protein